MDKAGTEACSSAYVRARDADPKSSFGDVAALSRPVDLATAEFLRTVICDAVIAPGFEPGTVGVLAAKRGGGFLILEADPGRVPPASERRDVLGVTIEQERDTVLVVTVLPDDGTLDDPTRTDALLGLATLRYTQSNSVALVRGGAAIGIGAGQQNRVDCVRLAGAKARTWWLRRHPFVDDLPGAGGMGRQDRLNWQIRFACEEMTAAQLAEFESLFGTEARSRYEDATWRDEWIAALSGVTMTSDGYLPFRDNVEYAAAAGVTTIVEPGGSAARAKSATAPPRTASPTFKPASACSITAELLAAPGTLMRALRQAHPGGASRRGAGHVTGPTLADPAATVSRLN